MHLMCCVLGALVMNIESYSLQPQNAQRVLCLLGAPCYACFLLFTKTIGTLNNVFGVSSRTSCKQTATTSNNESASLLHLGELCFSYWLIKVLCGMGVAVEPITQLTYLELFVIVGVYSLVVRYATHHNPAFRHTHKSIHTARTHAHICAYTHATYPRLLHAFAL